LGGGGIIKGLHYDDTYSPVVSWKNIRLFLIMIAKNVWHTTSTRADKVTTTYMELPTGVNLTNLSKDKHCILIIMNIYGGKDSVQTWFQHLRKHLIHKLQFIKSQYDAYVFYQKPQSLSRTTMMEY
jgi:hypothetical protein